MPIAPDDPIYALRRELAAGIVRSLGPDAQHVISRSYGIPQPRMSELNRVVDHCSMEWLIRRIYSLGGPVTVTVRLAMRGASGVARGSRRSPEEVADRRLALAGGANSKIGISATRLTSLRSRQTAACPEKNCGLAADAT